MNDVNRDYYNIVGVPEDASQFDIVLNAACVRLAAKWRPENHPGDVVAESNFRLIEEAYETLGDPVKRATYDFSLRALAGEVRPISSLQPYAPPAGPVALKFTGQQGEYFRIWIVNVCLSVITLGIYSAWAKVRR